MDRSPAILKHAFTISLLVFVLACTATAADERIDLDGLVDANSDFAFDLYAALQESEGNLFLSPYSISTALAMTHLGARHETARQMADVLHFAKIKILDKTFAALMERDRNAGSSAGCRLDVANALWGQEGYGFLDDFIALSKRHYGAGLREVDFGGACEEARQTINRWVAKQTEQRIKELLRKTDLDPSAALILTNAIYFKGSWASRFDAARTKERPFFVDGENKVLVSTMNRMGEYAVARFAGVDILEMPYEGDRLSMVLLVPGQDSSLAQLERSLDRENLDHWLAGLRKDVIHVFLPRFKVAARFDLADTLSRMGMPHAFSPGEADFSGITGKKDLFISAVIHQACAEVTEEGTEAAASTAVVMKRGYPRFDVNRPFIFLVRDRSSGSIHFVGRIVDPTQ